MLDKDTIIKTTIDEYLQTYDIKTMPIDQVRGEIIDLTDNAIELENSVKSKGRKMTMLKEFLTPYQVYRIAKELELIHNIRRGRTITPAVYVDSTDDKDYGLYKLLTTKDDEERYFFDVCRRIQGGLPIKPCIEVLSYLKSEAGRFYKVETEDEALVAVHNGVVNVYEKDPAEHFIDWEEARKRDYVFTTKWARDYNPNAKQPVFHDTENNRDVTPEDVILDISGDEERAEAIKAAMHAVLRPNWRVEAAMLLVDPNYQGNNGKSSLGEVLQSLTGDGNYVSTKISELDGDFSLASLLDARAIISTDADDSQYIEHSGNFKMLTCNEAMTIHIKYKSDVTYKWQGKIWASTNGYPRFREVSDAIDKRLYLIDCNTHFSVDDGATGLKKNKDIKDVFLKDNDTLEYIFKMLLDLDYRELPVFDFQKQLKKDFRSETNPVDQFLNEITDESVRNEVVEGWNSNICPNPHWNFYPVDYLYLLFQGFYYQNYNKKATMSIQKFRISLRSWVKKNNEEWELPLDGKGEMMRVSHKKELEHAECFTKKYMSYEAGNATELQKNWCNTRLGNAHDDSTIYMPQVAKTKYTCIRRKDLQEEDN